MSYESIVHDTLLDNYGAFTFNGTKTGNAYADFLLGLPSTMTQDAPIRKTDNGWYAELVRAGRLPRPPASDAEPRPALRRAVPVHGSRRTASSPMSPGRSPRYPRRHPRACSSRATPAFRAASPAPTGTTSRRASASPGIPSATAGPPSAPPSASSTAAPPATSGTPPPTTSPSRVRQPFPRVFTLSDPYRNTPGGNPFPFVYDPASPRFTLPAQVFGPSLDFVWPYTYQMNFTVEKQLLRRLQRERVLRGSARTQDAGGSRPELPRLRAGSHRGQRQRAAAVPAGRRSARPACSSPSSPPTTTASR